MGDLVSIPGLGSRSVAQQQLTLFALLGGSLVLLAGVTFYALSQSDKAAQQLGAIGQALMQSQRLAKSVSQAVVGSAKAFPDVSDSAGVLSKTTRGLQSGDDELHLAALGDKYAHELERSCRWSIVQKERTGRYGAAENSDADPDRPCA